MKENIVIVGGGQAAAQTVQSLRAGGFDGRITLVGDEDVLPYQRPPLSKAYMKGELERERLYFKPLAWYEENNVDLLLGKHATSIDRQTRSVILGREKVTYDALVIATGSRPRKLPLENANASNVFDLRTVNDVERMRQQMIRGARLVIIGAGFIGLEAAAIAQQSGLEVTVLEQAPRVLARVTSPTISAFYEKMHREKGVDIRTGTRLESFDARDGSVTAVRLADGSRIEADIVLVGIGIVPNEQLALDAGLPCNNGILVDASTRTADPLIFAAGDCTRRPLSMHGLTGRLESVHNAIEQGKLAAAAILGCDTPAEDCPWFWSDQYDLKLQIAGLSEGYDEMVLRGYPESESFAAFYLRDGQLVAADAINSPPEFLASKKLIASRARTDPELLRDKSISMKEIIARTFVSA